jgi:type IV secretion system protein VirD4
MTVTRALRFILPSLSIPLAVLVLARRDLSLASLMGPAAPQAGSGATGIPAIGPDASAAIDYALPFLAAATLAITILLAARRDVSLQAWAVLAGSICALVLSLLDPAQDPAAILDGKGPSFRHDPLAPSSLFGPVVLVLTACLALRVARQGHLRLISTTPRRISGKRALYGEAAWMEMSKAQVLFDEAGGIVIGEAYRVDRDTGATGIFRADDRTSWGQGGRGKLLCFDASFGSTHGIVFAGSGGFKTTSVTIPSALRWAGALIVLDPSAEVATRVLAHRKTAGRRTVVLDPRRPETGFNALDWIGQFGHTKEEDIASVASWIMSDNGRTSGARDDFFRASALQLLTAMIADVCLSGHTPKEKQTLRTVRANLSEPETKLRERLGTIFAQSASDFVRENVAAFVNMTPETFSGVYANAIKETHWLSYENYAALVSGSTFRTDAVASGKRDVFINIDLKTLETHSGLARVIIGTLLNAIYNHDGANEGRALFLLDEVARLGYMRVLETARDAGRKYGITLVMIYQSIGQLRETYGGRDAASKWFESASWISFAAINDPETAEYISRRCGMTTVEIDQMSRSSQARGNSRTRSKQLAARPLILPHEVLLMRADEQIVFTAGNPPLRCGRAIWFRRNDMRACVEGSPKGDCDDDGD